jgi:hypothetical protein
MPTLTNTTNILPNPDNAYNVAGQDSGNDTGPGFVSVKLSSEHKINNQRTNSGRLISRELSGHKWNIDITYNPLTREEFDPVYSFLLQSRGSMKPFFISLPQYSVPKDSTFASYGDVDMLWVLMVVPNLVTYLQYQITGTIVIILKFIRLQGLKHLQTIQMLLVLQIDYDFILFLHCREVYLPVQI